MSTPPSVTVRKLVKWLGWLVSIGCAVFFARTVHDHGLDVPGRAAASTLAFALVASAIYASAVLLLALAWSRMVQGSASHRPRSLPLISSYLIGQFAKYLPGNVMQYAARHGMGVRFGAAHGSLAGAAFAEIYLLLCAGTALSLFFASATLAPLVPALTRIPAALGVLPLLAAFGVSIPAKLWPRWNWLPRLPSRTIALVLCGYLLFFLLFGALYWASLGWAVGTGVEPRTALGSACVAWLAGFVLPGAPAGAGLREAALSVGTTDLLAKAEVSAAILLFRLVTFGGDSFAFVSGWLLLKFSGIEPGSETRKGS